MNYSDGKPVSGQAKNLMYRFKKANAYPLLCVNSCRIDSMKYNDSYFNVVLQDGFLKKSGARTKDAMLSVEGGGEVVRVFLTEVIPKEGKPSTYKTTQLEPDEFIKMLEKCEAEIQEEYHSANRIILRGELFRPARFLELNHHMHLFELQFRSQNDLKMYYYFND